MIKKAKIRGFGQPLKKLKSTIDKKLIDKTIRLVKDGKQFTLYNWKHENLNTLKN